MSSKIPEIKPYPKNAKLHPAEQVELIAKSIKRFGWQQPIVVDKDHTIIVGHGRWLAWEQHGEGMDEPWVQDNEGMTLAGSPGRKLTPGEVKAYRLADNQINALSGNDEKLVDDELYDIEQLEDEELLELTGHDQIKPEIQEDFSVPDGEQSEYEQMAFTLHREQAELIREALRVAQQLGLEIDTDNENSNGNALYTVCKLWLQQKT